MLKLKVRIEKDGDIDQQLVVLGLSDINIQRLTNDKPVFVRGEELKIEHDIVIVHGRTEQDIVKSLTLLGIIPPGATPSSPVEG